MRRHQDAKVNHFDVSNVIYHKFSHGAVSYTLNGENVNAMLEFVVSHGVFCFFVFFRMAFVRLFVFSSGVFSLRKDEMAQTGHHSFEKPLENVFFICRACRRSTNLSAN